MLIRHIFKANKTKIKVGISQLIGNDPKFTIKHLFCITCKKTPSTNDIMAFCNMSSELIQLSDMECIAIKRESTSKTIKILTQKGKYSDEVIIKKFMKYDDAKIIWRYPVKIDWNINE